MNFCGIIKSTLGKLSVNYSRPQKWLLHVFYSTADNFTKRKSGDIWFVHIKTLYATLLTMHILAKLHKPYYILPDTFFMSKMTRNFSLNTVFPFSCNVLNSEFQTDFKIIWVTFCNQMILLIFKKNPRNKDVLLH